MPFPLAASCYLLLAALVENSVDGIQPRSRNSAINAKISALASPPAGTRPEKVISAKATRSPMPAAVRGRPTSSSSESTCLATAVVCFRREGTTLAGIARLAARADLAPELRTGRFFSYAALAIVMSILACAGVRYPTLEWRRCRL